MCWFVTIEIHSAGVEALEELTRGRSAFAIRKSLNPHVARIFGAGGVRYELTHGGCSCDIYAAPHVLNLDEQVRIREKYQKKGWSEAKIRRALEASQKAKSASIGRSRERGPERYFHEAVSKQVHDFGRVRLFVHMYAGGVDEEVVTCNGCQCVSLASFLEASIPPDTLVEIIENAS